MSLPVEIHLLAEGDLVDAWTWYEAKESGLGDRFLGAVRSAIAQIADWPGSGSPLETSEGDVVERRIATTGFPYVIRYRVADDSILVTAVHHQRRRPDFGIDRSP